VVVVDVGAVVVVEDATLVTVLVVLEPHEASASTSTGTATTIRTRVTVRGIICRAMVGERYAAARRTPAAVAVHRLIGR
jgi:hypothetical protein